MAMLCMAGKSLIACSLQPSQPSKRDRGEKKIKAIVKVTLAEVLLEVDNILCDHDGILDVGLNPLQALDALLAGVPGQNCSKQLQLNSLSPSAPKSVTDTHSLTDVDCSVHKVVMDNGILSKEVVRCTNPLNCVPSPAFQCSIWRASRHRSPVDLLLRLGSSWRPGSPDGRGVGLGDILSKNWCHELVSY